MCHFTPRTEREQLEEALNRPSVRDHMWCPDGRMIIEAARKHLETMPKPKRKVNITRYAVVLKDGCAVGVYRTRLEAEQWLKYYAPQSRAVVEMTGEYEE